MGQESGRAAWPRPAGGYQTITGRRYGRRHAFISFRPSFKASGRYRTQNPARVENYGGAARENLSRQQHIAPKSALSTMLRTILPVPNSVHPELRGRTGRDSVGKKQPSIRRLAEGATIQYKKLKTDPKVISEPRNDGCEESEKTKESTSWSETEECLTNSALGFVSIDAYEPDSSGGEEEEEESAGMSEQQEPPVGQQRRLDDMIFELGKDFDYLRGLHSFLYTKTDQPSKDSTETDCGTGLNPEGCDAERRLEEWPVNGAGETNDRCGAEEEEEEEDSAAAAGSAAETECRTRTVSIESRAEVGDQVEVWDEPGPLTGQTLAPPAFRDPLEASAVSPYCPLCPATGSGERGGGPSTTETEWRHAGGWQNLGGSQDGGVWGSEDRGAGLDPGAVAGSSASNGEQVVRPKIRKQSSETHLEQERGPDPLPAHCGSSARANRPTRTSTQAKCVSAPPFFLTQTDRPNPELLFSFPQAERMREEEERMREWLERRTEGLRRRRRREDEWRRDERRKEEESCRLDSDEDADDDIWEDLEVFNDKMAPFIKAEECSECSEGEWFWPSDSGLDKERRSSEEESSGGGSSKEDKGSHEGSWEKNRRSSEESWETLPGLEEISSTSSSLEETAPLSTDTGTSQPQLEEGEVPWLMYNQEASSSEDEEGPDPGSHFVHPGLFILDGNNNLDDDSSMSEDLDAEWRLLDDFGEGFGMAQAISYVDPQLLTYMALEERLAQAMEAALAHLESLAIDVEQAHPPATEQIIDCLPHITIQEEHSGQEQCCAICCSEYVREEVATQLPCNHMFHKLCVTLWLQKSGTCPVCRHILTPPLPEAPPPTSFLSDQEVPPSNHSTAGTR